MSPYRQQAKLYKDVIEEKQLSRTRFCGTCTICNYLLDDVDGKAPRFCSKECREKYESIR